MGDVIVIDAALSTGKLCTNIGKGTLLLEVFHKRDTVLCNKDTIRLLVYQTWLAILLAVPEHSKELKQHYGKFIILMFN